MRIGIDGSPLFGARKPGTQTTEKRIYQKKFGPDKISKSMLRKYLCELGPKKCAKCRLCEYGKEWVRRYENTTRYTDADSILDIGTGNNHP